MDAPNINKDACNEEVAENDSLSICKDSIETAQNSDENSLISTKEYANERPQQQQSSSLVCVARSGSPPSASKNKLQLQTQHQHYQFRTPQQFVRHRKTALYVSTSGTINSCNSKKSKTWNKKQNKGSKQQQINTYGDNLLRGNIATLSATEEGCATTLGSRIVSQDLENIQNIRNQSQYLTAFSEGNSAVEACSRYAGCEVLPSNNVMSSDETNYSHGHVKYQFQKKIIGHRNHHHDHVLCAGIAHNAVGGNDNALCSVKTACTLSKDVSSINNLCSGSIGNISSGAIALHYCCGRTKFFLPDKRPRKEIIIPPTKFLLGGNISDPLNLSSLQNDTSNTSSNNTPATTPRQSPITTPPKVEVIIPPNIHDPLHLLDPVDSMEYEKQLTSPMKRGHRGLPCTALGLKAHKHRYRKNRKPKRRRHESHNSSTNAAESEDISTDVTKLSGQNAASIKANIERLTDASSDANTDGGNKFSQSDRNCVQQNNTDALHREIMASSSILQKNRALSRDLQLDLKICVNNTLLSNPCSVGSGMVTGNRKRKVSETNNSAKSKKFHRDSMDKIVSPVVPQPGAWKRPPRLVSTGSRKSLRRTTSVGEADVSEDSKAVIIRSECASDTISETGIGSPQSTSSITEAPKLVDLKNEVDDKISNINKEELISVIQEKKMEGVAILYKTPKFKHDGIKYRYGNYDRYTSFRQLNEFMDVRLQVFHRHTELFKNKDILDIGCNVGYMTITVARNFAPKSILGIDIDKELIERARTNLSMFVRIPHQQTCSKPQLKEKDDLPTKICKENKVKLGINTELSKAKPKRKRRSRNAVTLQFQDRSHNLLYPIPGHHRSNHNNQQYQNHQHFHQHIVPHKSQLYVDVKELFPVSFPLIYGNIPHSKSPASSCIHVNSSPIVCTLSTAGTQTAATSLSTSSSINSNTASFTTGSSLNNLKSKNDFPYNVFFRHTNYVLKNESLICNDSQQYDLILCLSVTKWIHLNFGDAGLKLAFKRMFNQLRPGGKLILEAQNWASYKKKKNMTEDIYNNYRNIEFLPNKFHEYLLSSEVGFSHSYTLGVPRHFNKGFCRPIQLYAKGDYTPNHVQWSDTYYPQTPYEAYRGIYATMPPRPADLIYPHSSTRSQAYDTPHYNDGMSGPYSCRRTPMQQPTSQYYNPLETDSYLPSYDMEYLNHMYVFASPLYQTVWSPPSSLRNSSSHTSVFGSVRDAEIDGEGGVGSSSYHRHVYPPNDELSSPNANAGGAFNSIRDADTDDSNQLPTQNMQHVYATNYGESSLSPVVNHHSNTEGIDEALLTDEDQQSSTTGHFCDVSES